MKTKFRTATIILTLGLLSSFGGLLTLILSKTDIANIWQEPTAVVVFFVLFSLLLVGGIFGVVWFTLRVDINLDKKTIVFTYPFRFQRLEYGFNDLLGFRYKYLNGKVEYKSLKFKTKGDNRVFSVSDFETVNLRDLERFSISHFDLRAGKGFEKLTDGEKLNEIENSRHFDHQQAKDIRFYLVLYAAVLTFILGALIYRLPKLQGTKFMVLSLISVGLFVAIILTVKRVLRLHERIKNGA